MNITIRILLFVLSFATTFLATTQAFAQESEKIDRTIGVCQLVNTINVGRGVDQWKSPIYSIEAAHAVSNFYTLTGYKKWLDYTKNIKVTLLKGVEHGSIKSDEEQDYRYFPVENYIGPDRAAFLVEIEGLKVKVIYYFNVIDGGAIGGTEVDDKVNCPKGMYWKISIDRNSINLA